MRSLIRVGAAVVLFTVAACSKSVGSGSGGTSGIGQPAVGEVAWKFVGRLDQDGAKFSGYGYVTFLSGLADADLYASTPGTEKTARFTVVIAAQETGVNKLNDLTVVNTSGTATIYRNDQPAGDFADPSSFAKGTVVAVTDVSGQNILSINPDDRNKGIAAATAQLHQTTANSFPAGAGGDKPFGRVGLVERMALSGQGKRTDPNGPKSLLEVAGDVIVARG